MENQDILLWGTYQTLQVRHFCSLFLRGCLLHQTREIYISLTKRILTRYYLVGSSGEILISSKLRISLCNKLCQNVWYAWFSIWKCWNWSIRRHPSPPQEPTLHSLSDLLPPIPSLQHHLVSLKFKGKLSGYWALFEIIKKQHRRCRLRSCTARSATQ